MWPRNSKRAILWIASVSVLVLVTLAGCARVEVVDTTPAISTPASSTSPPSAVGGEHSLALLAVDFDPPLSYQHLIMQRQSVDLLVAIQNTGRSTEFNVTVHAQLSTSEDPEMLLTQGASIADIAPGEVQVVRLAHLGEIPYHQTYHLEVRIEPVDGESDLDDNLKAFDIQIYQEQDNP